MERDTQQRRAIRRAFREAGRPLSPQEVLAVAGPESPGIGPATVYRTVKGLVERGWLTPVALPGEPPRYEVSGKEHHHHFHCRGCGRLYELEGCPEGLKTLTPSGFHLEAHEVVLYGRCSGCAA
jgi:Fur family transcriptional regulator, ferric uptake regulator